ncbi:MAG TPA: hypothetical protein VD998_02205 [Verrucomicrobiae bacterium]|nr:hypothetical protein [Verrucomicrobiae bacterium]
MNELRKPVVVISIALIVLLVGVIAYVSTRNTEQTLSNTVPDEVARNNYTQEGVDETPDEPAQSTSEPRSTSRLTYTEALKIYGQSGNNFRFQFTTGCAGSPSKLVMKKGTKFMIDNRDTVAHTIVVGSQSYRLQKYGFIIATARDIGDYAIKCDGINRSQILVQP